MTWITSQRLPQPKDHFISANPGQKPKQGLMMNINQSWADCLYSWLIKCKGWSMESAQIIFSSTNKIEQKTKAPWPSYEEHEQDMNALDSWVRYVIRHSSTLPLHIVKVINTGTEFAAYHHPAAHCQLFNSVYLDTSY